MIISSSTTVTSDSQVKTTILIENECYPEIIFKNSTQLSDFVCPIGYGIINNPIMDSH